MGSVRSSSTYFSAVSCRTNQPPLTDPTLLQPESNHAKILAQQELWPVDPAVEQNWSGRGQHAEFQPHEQGLINSILEVQEDLGSTRTAIVQSVKYKRILLARKTIRCSKRTITHEEAIQEVAHLTRLHHAHILRVIGTYVKSRDLSILLYPVTEYNLETFLHSWQEYKISTATFSVLSMYGCLSSAVEHIHSRLTKHMGIKPQNILVEARGGLRVFIADFGISRSYETLEATETDGRTAFTLKYAAPEVVQQDIRGLSADVFSLGCVFLGIHVAIKLVLWRSDREMRFPWSINHLPRETRDLKALLHDNVHRDGSYQANLEGLLDMLGYGINNTGDGNLPDTTVMEDRNGMISRVPTPQLLAKMLSRDPKARPTARELHQSFGETDCCLQGPKELATMVDTTTHEEMEEDSDASDKWLETIVSLVDRD